MTPATLPRSLHIGKYVCAPESVDRLFGVSD